MASGNATEYPTSDSEEDNDDDSSDDGRNEDDEWSGHDSSVEAIILQAVGDDLPLAAHLIPILHRELQSKLNVTEKLALWSNNVKSAVHENEANGGQSSNYKTDPINNPRKRQRRQGSSNNQSREGDDFGEEDDEEDDDAQNFKGMEDGNRDGSQQQLLRLACPFHKRFPAKYGIQHDEIEGSGKAKYRACAGPGFKSIQRLKYVLTDLARLSPFNVFREHLKRKHYPVQCDRCYDIFQGNTDRAARVLELQSHLQLPVPCERRSPSEKEGISDAQWANLDKKKNIKKSQVVSRVDLWMEYWNILFPGVLQPATPCEYTKPVIYKGLLTIAGYDHQPSNRMPKTTSEDARRFAVLFQSMLSHKVNQQYIRFLPGHEEEMKSRVETLASQSFSLCSDLNDSPSAMNSSSSRTQSGQQSSMLGSSFQHLSTPRTSHGQHSRSDSRSTAAQSQAYSMDISSSPTAVSMARRSLSQGHPTHMAPPFIMPRVPAENFAPNTIPSSLQNGNDQQSHGGFDQNLGSTIQNFSEGSFADNGMGAGGPWDMNFDTANSSFYGGHPPSNLDPAEFVHISQSPLGQILDPSDENGGNLPRLQGFDQYTNSADLHYDGTQRR